MSSKMGFTSEDDERDIVKELFYNQWVVATLSTGQQKVGFLRGIRGHYYHLQPIQTLEIAEGKLVRKVSDIPYVMPTEWNPSFTLTTREKAELDCELDNQAQQKPK
jgi:hypothetical protein